MTLRKMLDQLLVPVFQAPMAGVSNPEIAAAVTNAGGLGALGLGASIWTEAEATMSAFRAISDGPVHVNFFCHEEPKRDPDLEQSWIHRFNTEFEVLGTSPPTTLANPYDSSRRDRQLIDFTRTFAPEVVSFHFGLPSKNIVEALKSSGTAVLTSVTNLNDAMSALGAGADGLIAQGIEAGGHRGTFDARHDDAVSTGDLVAELTRLTDRPIIAAGGIMTGADILSMLSLGAAACQLGTAFLLCPEASTTADYRHQIKQATSSDTLITRAISGRAARGINNRITHIGDATLPSDIPDYPISYDLTKRLNAIATKQDVSGYGAYWAGTGVAKTREVTASNLVKSLAAELTTARAAARS